MSKARVHVVNGIEYPREVPVPDGLPEGWKAVEQAYGPGTKSEGKTYIRYHSLDGRHRQLMGPKQVIEEHCKDSGKDFQVEFARYEAIQREKEEAKKAERAAEREARGQADGERREELIALSRATYGELTGPIVLGFPGWKCRWDYLPNSDQTPKTFIGPDGRDWKLLKDLECMFGTRIDQQDTEEISCWVEAGRKNTAAHTLFKQGSARAKETMASVLIDPAEENAVVDCEKEVVRKKRDKASYGRIVSRGDYLEKKSWKVLKLDMGQDVAGQLEASNVKDVPFWSGAAKHVCERLMEGKFDEDVDIIFVHDLEPGPSLCIHAHGIYYQRPEKYNGHAHYQLIQEVPNTQIPGPPVLLCRPIYLFWSDQSCWKIGSLDEKKAGIAICDMDAEKPFLSHPWSILNLDAAEVTPSVGERQVLPAPVAEPASAAPCSLNAQTEDKKRPAPPNDSEAPAAKRREPGRTAATDGTLHTERIWTYKDVRRRRTGEELPEVPKHWPPGVRVCPGPWVHWLPEDWGQAQKEEPAGWKVKYISPEGKLCHDKAAVVKLLPGGLVLEEKGIDWPPWLPKNWHRSSKAQGSGKKPIYITPDFRKFMWCKSAVEECIKDGTVGATGGDLRMSEEVRMMLPEELRPAADTGIQPVI